MGQRRPTLALGLYPHVGSVSVCVIRRNGAIVDLPSSFVRRLAHSRCRTRAKPDQTPRPIRYKRGRRWLHRATCRQNRLRKISTHSAKQCSSDFSVTKAFVATASSFLEDEGKSICKSGGIFLPELKESAVAGIRLRDVAILALHGREREQQRRLSQFRRTKNISSKPRLAGTANGAELSGSGQTGRHARISWHT